MSDVYYSYFISDVSAAKADCREWIQKRLSLMKG